MLLVSSLLLAQFLALAPASTAQSQTYCPSTVPDCFTSPWIEGGCVYVTIYNPYRQDSCEVQVCYCYREACGYYDYTLVTMSWSNNCDSGMTWSEFRTAVHTAFAKLNPEDFPCSYPDEPSVHWRFLNITCYEKVTVGLNTVIAQPCDGEDVWCYTKYTVYCDLNGNVVIFNAQTGVFGPVQCEEPCYDICD